MTAPNSDSRAVARLVSAEEREAAVQLLTAAFASDAIQVAEFEQRVAAVYTAETSDALREITRDLPETETLPAVVNQPTAVARAAGQEYTSILSSVERSIQGPMPEALELKTVMGSIELDLRGAEFPPGVTEIHVRSIMGNIEVELPDTVRVEHQGHAFLANFAVSGRSRVRGTDEAPVVRITGRSILANVEIEVD